MNIPDGIDKAKLPEMLRIMVLSREIELREERLKKQGRGWFQIGGRGHEGLLGAAMAMRKGHDWLYGHYRDRIRIRSGFILPVFLQDNMGIVTAGPEGTDTGDTGILFFPAVLPHYRRLPVGHFALNEKGRLTALSIAPAPNHPFAPTSLA